MTTLASVVRCQ